MTSFLSILAKSSGAVDQNLAVDKGNNGDVLISTTTGFSFVSANTLTANLSQVLLAGNTATNNINLTGNVSANTFIGNLTGTANNATTATNIAGGAGGSIPYQSSANTTALLPNGSNGQYLKSLGSTNPPVWDNFPVVSTPTLSQVLIAGNTATNNILLNNTGVGTNVISLLPNVGVADPQITLTDGTTTNTINKNGYTTRNSVQNVTHYLNFSDNSATGTGAIQKSTGIECNPSTKTITTTTFIGNLTGTASNATSATTATTATTATNITTTSDNTSGTYFIPFSKTSAGVSTQIFLDDTTTALTYNPSTSNLTANTFTGNLTATNITVASPYNFSVISIYGNSTSRDAALPSPYTGQFCFLTGTNVLQYYNSGAWTTYGGGGVLTPVLPTISGFTLGANYEIIYVNSGNTVVPSATAGGFTIVRFYPTTTTSGTISLSQSVAITYLLVAGGGGGAGAITSLSNGGGGGAGGYLSSTDNMTASVSYALQVGGGGAGGSGTFGTVGTNTNLAVASTTIIANGGGAGGSVNGGNGGSGGGGAATNAMGSTTGGTGSQGQNGGGGNASGVYYSGGGGGATSAGSGSGVKGNGGNGTANTITGASITYAGGGGGGSNDVSTNPATGGTGGGGNGGAGVPASTYTPATAGTDGLGGGGGGGGQGASANVGFKGGAGIVIVRFTSFI